jgi:hypothetical protein
VTRAAPCGDAASWIDAVRLGAPAPEFFSGAFHAPLQPSPIS